jgi:carboxypeptidase Q
MRLRIALTVVLIPLANNVGGAADNVAGGASMVDSFLAEEHDKSEIPSTITYLGDEVGSRLSGSPELRRAFGWLQAKLRGYGVDDVHLESFGFGPEWRYSGSVVKLVTPFVHVLTAVPEAWTPGTRDPIRAEVEQIDARTSKEVREFHGTLKGKIVLLGAPRDPKRVCFPSQGRLSDSDLAMLAKPRHADTMATRNAQIATSRAEWRNQRDILPLLEAQGVAAILKPSSREADAIAATGYNYRRKDLATIPVLVLALSDYNLLARLAASRRHPSVYIEVRAAVVEGSGQSENLVADIRGTRWPEQIVMAGAHLDSWHAGTGATDNAAGVAAIVEAIRLLEKYRAHPLRTIRIGLWSGEEQGYLGSNAYVEGHLAAPHMLDAEERALPIALRRRYVAVDRRPMESSFSVYFNLDRGTGAIRGLYSQDNTPALPILERWIHPLRKLRVAVIAPTRSYGSDHESFEKVGLPGLDFIQDPLDSEIIYHTGLDMTDHVQIEDLKQAAVVVATLLHEAAVEPQLFPRGHAPAD